MSRRVEALAIGLAVSTLLIGVGWMWAGLRERDGRVREARARLERSTDMVRAAVDESLEELRAREDERAYYLYNRYYSPPDVLAISDPVALSPLAAEPNDRRLVGYFQIDPGGALNTPYDEEDALGAARMQRIAELTERPEFEPIRALALDERDAIDGDGSIVEAERIEAERIEVERPEANADGAREGRLERDVAGTPTPRARIQNRVDRWAQPAPGPPTEAPEPPEPELDNALTGLNQWSNEQAVQLARAQSGDVAANSRLIARGRQVPQVSRRNVAWDELPQASRSSGNRRPSSPSQSAAPESDGSQSSNFAALLGATLLPSIESTRAALLAQRAAISACTQGAPVVARLRLRGADGAVESADLEPLPEGVTGRDCVLERLRAVRVSPFASPTAVVRYAYTDDAAAPSAPVIMNPDNFGNLVSHETEVDYTPMVYGQDPGALYLHRVVADGDVSVVQGLLLDVAELRSVWIPAIVARHDQAAIEVVGQGEGACAVRRSASAVVEGLELCIPPEVLAALTDDLDAELRWQVGVLALLWLIAALAAAAIVVAARRAEALSRQKSAFVSAVSHELRTPLTTLRMHAEMLDEGMVSARRQPKVHRELVRESVRLSRLVENVLSLAKLEEGKRTLRLEEGDLRGHVRAVVEEQRAAVEERGFTLEGPGEGALPARFDAQAIEQIVTNLIDNALKYAADSDERSIRVTVRPDGEGAQLIVEDRGPGIPEADLRRVFERFHRVEREETAHAPGTGIGLALVAELADAHGGAASAHRRDGGGLEIRVRLSL